MNIFTHKYVEASTLTIILKLATVITFILSVVFLHEAITLLKVIGLVLIVGANVLIFGWPIRIRFDSDKGLLYALLLTLILGIAWTIDKFLIPFYGLVLYTFIGFFSPAVGAYIAPPVALRDLSRELRMGSWKMVIMALFNISGYVLMLKALMLGEASKVIPIATATTPLVILLGVVILGERDNIVRKILAGALIVAGIYMLR